MVRLKSSLSLLAKDLKIYPQNLTNIKVRDKNEVLYDEDIKNKIKEVEKDLEGKGRILVRASGTEPLIRVMVEAENEAMCKENVDKVVNLIRKKGFIVE